MKKKPNRQRLLTLVVIGLCVALIEVLSFLAVDKVLVPKGYVYDPARLQPLSSAEYHEAVAKVENISSTAIKANTNDGSRPSPGFDNSKPACVSLYGDSFTWADEVEDDQAWGHLLAERLNCRVANYGRAGYGIDQAVLRFENNPNDKASINVLAFFSEDIVRHVTRNVGWVYPQIPNALPVTKPRFVIGSDKKLTLVPVENPDFNVYDKYIYEPASYVSKDFLVPGGESGLTISRFPYTYRVLQSFFNYKIIAKIKGKPWYGDFYEDTHPTQALEISVGIVKRFVDLSNERGTQSMSVILPSILDFVHYEKHGNWIYEPLASKLKERSITAVNIAELFLEQKAIGDVCELYSTQTGKGECGGHYSVEANVLLADIMERLVLALPTQKD